MQNVDNKYELPRDVINKECLVEITGRKEILIENYRTIKTIGKNSIEILCKKYKIFIIGVNLYIKYYNKDSMVVGGMIDEISFSQSNN